MKQKVFTVSYLDRSYSVMVAPETNLWTAWLRIKNWFMPGSRVTIMDDKNNIKTFIKE